MFRFEAGGRAATVAVVFFVAAATQGAEATGEQAADLRFEQFYVQPVGRRGLQLTDHLRSLAGRQVRIAGYVVQNDESPAGSFVLAPMKIGMAPHADGPADDLPAAHILVFLPDTDAQLPSAGERVEIIGNLDVGRAEDPQGRVSWVRLRASSPSSGVSSLPQ